MKIHKKGILFIFFVLFVLCHAQIGIIPGILLVAEVARWSVQFWNFIKTGHHIISTLGESFGDTCSNEKKYTNAITGKVIQAIPQIQSQLESVSALGKERFEKLDEMIKKLELEIDVNARMVSLVASMGRIDNLYKELIGLVPAQKTMEFNGQDYCDFAHRQLYGSAPLSEKVDQMYNIIVPSQPLLSELLATISADLQSHHETLCDTGHSTLDYLHSIYTSLMLVEIKAYSMIAFSHNLLFNFNGTAQNCQYTHKNPEAVIKLAQKKLISHLQEYNTKFVKQMKKVTREFRACDRDEDFVRDETYFELEGAMQWHVLFPPDDYISIVNYDLSWNKCSAIQIAEGTPALYCHDKYKFCTTPVARTCRGQTRNCQTTPYWITGCLAQEDTSRRYEWLRWQGHDEYLKQLTDACPKNRLMDLTGATPHYDSCYCECIDNHVDSQSTHVFNLQWVESDIAQNMVITGIRFIVKNRVMQFQIQQGKLGSNFRIQEAEWKPVNDISEEIRAARLKRKLRGKIPDLVENRDYLVISKIVNDVINLDTLNVSFKNVLTGVRFRFSPINVPKLLDAPVDESKSSAQKSLRELRNEEIRTAAKLGAIDIAIKGTKFDHITGELCLKCSTEEVISQKKRTQRYHYPRKNINKPKFPTRPITQPGQFVHINASDVIHDSGQTTLPYFDAMPLFSSPPTPISGLGMFHKSAGDFTGLISLKFVSLDYPQYMESSANEYLKQLEIAGSPIKENVHL